jgi:hypothetical protein
LSHIGIHLIRLTKHTHDTIAHVNTKYQKLSTTSYACYVRTKVRSSSFIEPRSNLGTKLESNENKSIRLERLGLKFVQYISKREQRKWWGMQACSNSIQCEQLITFSKEASKSDPLLVQKSVLDFNIKIPYFAYKCTQNISLDATQKRSQVVWNTTYMTNHCLQPIFASLLGHHFYN